MMLIDVFGRHGIFLGGLDGSGMTSMSCLKTIMALAIQRCLEHDMLRLGGMMMMMVMVVRMVMSPWDMHVGAPVGLGITLRPSWWLDRL